jgi:hypothetical protein
MQAAGVAVVAYQAVVERAVLVLAARAAVIIQTAVMLPQPIGAVAAAALERLAVAATQLAALAVMVSSLSGTCTSKEGTWLTSLKLTKPIT